MPGKGLPIRLALCPRATVHALRRGTFRQQAQFSARLAVQKNAVGAHELQRVPFDRIVACSYYDPPPGPVVLYG